MDIFQIEKKAPRRWRKPGILSHRGAHLLSPCVVLNVTLV